MTGSFRVAFCVSGNGHLCRAAIENASALGILPAAVIAEAKASADLEAFCDSHGVPLIRLARAPRAEFDRALEDACRTARFDLLVLTFDRLLPPTLVAGYRGRIINLHPALLPAFAGLKPMEQALESGARFSGATIHEVDEGVDTGAIIAQCVVPLREGDTVESFGARLYQLMKPLYLQVIAWYAAGRVVRGGSGRLTVQGATYGQLPTSPAIEIEA